MGKSSITRGTAATLCVSGPHRGRTGTASPSTVRHSHRELGIPKVFGRRLQTSMTRATVEDSRRPLVGGPSFHGVFGMCTNPWHIGCQVEFKPRVFETRVSCSFATRTPWVALSAAKSEDPTESTSNNKTKDAHCKKRMSSQTRSSAQAHVRWFKSVLLDYRKRRPHQS